MFCSVHGQLVSSVFCPTFIIHEPFILSGIKGTGQNITLNLFCSYSLKKDTSQTNSLTMHRYVVAAYLENYDKNVSL